MVNQNNFSKPKKVYVIMSSNRSLSGKVRINIVLSQEGRNNDAG